MLTTAWMKRIGTNADIGAARSIHGFFFSFKINMGSRWRYKHTLKIYLLLENMTMTVSTSAPVGAPKNCLPPGYFTWRGRGIGYSFQPAITAPFYSIISYMSPLRKIEKMSDSTPPVLYQPKRLLTPGPWCLHQQAKGEFATTCEMHWGYLNDTNTGSIPFC